MKADLLYKTHKEIVEMEAYDIANWLAESFYVEVPYLNPADIITADDLSYISNVMVFSINNYNYLISILNFLKIAVRKEKRKGSDNKMNYEDMIDRRDIVSGFADVLLNQYKASSRLITTYQEITREKLV